MQACGEDSQKSVTIRCCLALCEGWRSLLSWRLFRLARIVLTSLDALALSRSALLSFSSSCDQECF